jgi:hypothetical protein
MTVDQMIESFLVYYDRITSFSAPGYEEYEKLLFLNNAQDDFIKDRMFGQNFQPPAFEDNQRRVADLRTLIVTPTALVYSSTDLLGARQYTLPANFMFHIKAHAICTRSNYPIVSSSEYFECNFIKSDQVEKVLNSTANKTHFVKPFIAISGSVVKLIVDRFTTNTGLSLQYLKMPTALIVGGTCDLPAHTHQEIVDMAVRQALQVLQDPRWQTSVQEEKIKSN